MPPPSLAPIHPTDDPRVEHRTYTVSGGSGSDSNNNITYSYRLARPQSGRNPVATILLLHGFPDLGLGWRYQIPFLTSPGMDLQVVVPDLLGYGQTSAPRDKAEYTYKKMCGHMAGLVRAVTRQGPAAASDYGATGEKAEDGEEKILLGGHDWGGYMAWRLAMWHPDLFFGVFSLAVHFTPPAPKDVGLEQLVEKVPTMRYQIQLSGPDLEYWIDHGERSASARNGGRKGRKERLKRWLGAFYGGDDGKSAVVSSDGVAVERLRKVEGKNLEEKSLLCTAGKAEREYGMLDHYVGEYARHGTRGPLNWYRVRDLNWKDEHEAFFQDKKLGDGGRYQFQMPAMLVMAKRDIAVPPQLAAKQHRFFGKGLKLEELDTSHWIMIEQPEEVNRLIGEFVRQVLPTGGDGKLKGKL